MGFAVWGLLAICVLLVIVFGLGWAICQHACGKARAQPDIEEEDLQADGGLSQRSCQPNSIEVQSVSEVHTNTLPRRIASTPTTPGSRMPQGVSIGSLPRNKSTPSPSERSVYNAENIILLQ